MPAADALSASHAITEDASKRATVVLRLSDCYVELSECGSVSPFFSFYFPFSVLNSEANLQHFLQSRNNSTANNRNSGTISSVPKRPETQDLSVDKRSVAYFVSQLTPHVHEKDVMVILPLHCMTLTPTPSPSPGTGARGDGAGNGAAAGHRADDHRAPFLHFFTLFLLGLNSSVLVPGDEGSSGSSAPAVPKLRIHSLSFFSNAMMDAIASGITHRAVIIHVDVKRIVISKMEKGRTARHGASFIGSLESILSMTPTDRREPRKESMLFTHEALERINLCDPAFKENLIYCFGTDAYAYFERQMEKDKSVAAPIQSKGKGKGKGRRVATSAVNTEGRGSSSSPYGVVNKLLTRVVRESPLAESFVAFTHATSTAPVVAGVGSGGDGPSGAPAAAGPRGKMSFHTLNLQHTYNSYINCKDRRLPLLITGDALRVRGLYHLLRYVGQQCSDRVLRVVQQEKREKEKERDERRRASQAASAVTHKNEEEKEHHESNTKQSAIAKEKKSTDRAATPDRKRRRDSSPSADDDDRHSSCSSGSEESDEDEHSDSGSSSSSDESTTSESTSDSSSDSDEDTSSSDSHHRKKSWLRVHNPPLPDAPYQCTAIGSAIWSGMMEESEGERDRYRVFAEELQRSTAQPEKVSTSVLWKAII